MEVAEFLLKLMTTIILILGILGMVMQSASYEGNLIVYDADRLTLNLGHAMLSAPCLAEEVNGETRRGVFEVSKLNSVKDLCVEVDARHNIKISGGGAEWEFGDTVAQGTNERSFPVSIKFSDERIVVGEMVVKVQVA